MLNRSNTPDRQADQRQGFVPLTPELAREIEKLLIKNAGALESLKTRHNAARSANEIQRQARGAQFSSS